MPYTRIDPSAAPSTVAVPQRTMPMGTDAEGLASSVRDSQLHSELSVELAELRSAVTVAAAVEESTAQTEVLSTSQAASLRDAGVALKQAWLAFDESAKVVRNDVGLSPKGRDDKLAALSAARESRIEAIATRQPGQQGDALLALYPAPFFKIAQSADISAEVQNIYAAFPSKLAGRFAQEALATLRAAVVTSSSNEVRYRSNRLLHAAFLPLCERRATAPERFAQGWQGFYGELAAAIAEHLDVVLGAQKHRIAVPFVESARQGFTFLDMTARQQGRWDDVYLIGAPIFQTASAT